MLPLPLLHRRGHTWVEASLALVPMRSWSSHLCFTRDSQAPIGGLLLGPCLPLPTSSVSAHLPLPHLGLSRALTAVITHPDYKGTASSYSKPKTRRGLAAPTCRQSPICRGWGLALPSWTQPRRRMAGGAGQRGDQGALHLDLGCPGAQHLGHCPWEPSCGQEPRPHPRLACASEALSLL